jgi:hypothetical protein
VRSFFLTASMLLASSLVCFGETLDGHLMPSKCKNEDMKTHTKECALACKSTGFGIVTASGEYVSFNRAGNTKAGDLLRSSEKTADLEVSVKGTRNGTVFEVESITWK